MLLMALLMIFAIIGICELIYIVRLLICHPNIRMQNYSLIVLDKNQAIKQLLYLWQKIRWQGDEFAIGIVAITDNLDYDEICECEKFTHNKNITLCMSKNIDECIRLL